MCDQPDADSERRQGDQVATRKAESPFARVFGRLPANPRQRGNANDVAEQANDRAADGEFDEVTGQPQDQMENMGTG